MRVRAEHRSRKRLAGRFGGGWQFVVGVKATRRCVVIELGIFMVRIVA